MSIVVVGSVAYDGVETPHGKVDRMLGGACTYICLAASYFAKTKIVAVVGDDFAAESIWKAWSASREVKHFSGRAFIPTI
jgi:sugar/nucleoside kinase (ribokinase family)